MDTTDKQAYYRGQARFWENQAQIDWRKGKVAEAHSAYAAASEYYEKAGDMDEAARCRYESLPYWKRGHAHLENEKVMV